MKPFNLYHSLRVIFCLILIIPIIAFASIGGERLTRNDGYYDLVQIRIISTKVQASCLGAFINDHTIVTAAHCLWNKILQRPIKLTKNNLFAYYSFIPQKKYPDNDYIFNGYNPPVPIIIKQIAIDPDYIKYKTIVSDENKIKMVMHDVALIFTTKAANYDVDSSIARLFVSKDDLQAYNLLLNQQIPLSIFGVNKVANLGTTINTGKVKVLPYINVATNSCSQAIDKASSEISKFQQELTPDIYNLTKEKIDKYTNFFNALKELSDQYHVSIFYCTTTPMGESNNIMLTLGDSGSPLIVKNNQENLFAGINVSGFNFTNYRKADGTVVDLSEILKPYLTYKKINLYSNLYYYNQFINNSINHYSNYLNGITLTVKGILDCF